MDAELVIKLSLEKLPCTFEFGAPDVFDETRLLSSSSGKDSPVSKLALFAKLTAGQTWMSLSRIQ